MFNKLMNNQNPFWKFMSKMFDVMILNFIWTIFSIPVISIGTTITALYDVCFQIIQENNYGTLKTFWSSCKLNWKKGTIIGLFFFGLVAVLISDILYFLLLQDYLSKSSQNIICALVTMILIIVTATGNYAFALQALFENTVANTIKNAAILALRHSLRSFGILLFDLIFLLAAVFSLIYIPIVSIGIMLFGAALMIFINCLIMLPVLEPFLPKVSEAQCDPEIYD